MASSNAEFRRMLGIGKIAEDKISTYLKALGYYVLPTTNFSEKGAPKLEAENSNDSIVMPDLQAFKSNVRCWFECKWKTRATENNRGKLETGVDLRLYDNYLDSEQTTGMPVALVFVHEHEQVVRCATLKQLDEGAFSHRYSGGNYTPMIYWYFENIPVWMSLDELAAAVFAYQNGARLLALTDPPIGTPHVLERHAGIQARSHKSDPFTAKTRFAAPMKIAKASGDCDRCGDDFSDRKIGHVTLTVQDRLGAQTLCSKCWSQLYREGAVS